MSANQSNLSPTGFDYVVAVTQDSINATLEHYLWRSGLPEVILCYVYDNQNQPKQVDFAAFLKQVKTDPFTIPDGTASSDPRVQALNNANFAFAIKAKLGLPPGVVPANAPPVVVLKPGQSSVTYTLMFAEFVATEIIYGPRDSMTWFNQSQPNGTSWTFSGNVDLNFQSAEFAKLPPAIQQRLKGLGDPSTFSVQQLYYDLNSSNLQPGFEFNKVPSNSALNTFMTADFINTYWKDLKASGSGTILGYGAKQIKSPSFVTVTDLNHFVPQPVGNTGAPSTLNYLCATNNHALPGTSNAGFGWNWLEHGDVKQYHGVAALNRNTLAQYLNDKLYQQLPAYCYCPTVKLIDPSHGEPMPPRIPRPPPTYTWNMESGQTPAVSYPPSGSTILHYLHAMGTTDQMGSSSMQLATSFELSVKGQGSQLVIIQHLVVWLEVINAANKAAGNVVDKWLTDTFTISVDATGRIVLSAPTSVPVDNSQSPGVNGFLNFWAPVNDIVADVKQWSQLPSRNLTDINLSGMRDFILPGGASFTSLDATFSENQDLVSHIRYANPS